MLRELPCYKMFYDRKRKCCPFNTGDCLIEVTTWAGLTVFLHEHQNKSGWNSTFLWFYKEELINSIFVWLLQSKELSPVEKAIHYIKETEDQEGLEVKLINPVIGIY